MKNKILLLLCLLTALSVRSQLNFNVPTNGCVQTPLYLWATSGTLAVSGYTWTSSPSATISTPFASTTAVIFSAPAVYTIELTADSGNTITVLSATITVESLPVIQISQPTFTTCIATNGFPINSPLSPSQPVTMSVTGAENYNVFPYLPQQNVVNGMFTVRPYVSTCFTVAGNTGTGCVGQAIACLTVIPQFTLQTLAGNTVVCVSDSVQLGVINAQGNFAGTLQQFTYDWYEPATAPPPSLNFYGTQYVFAYPANAATYTVEAHDTRACASVPAVVTVSVAACLGLNDPLALGREIVAFPNPTGDVLAFRFNWPWAELSVTDLTGRKVLFYQVVESEQALDLTVLPPGLYVAHLNYGGVTERVRISKN